MAGTEVRRVDADVLSVLPVHEQGAPYDRRAAAYDRLVRSPRYNRLLWSARPSDYAAFAHEAVADATGPLLEVGCGAATFTWQAYRATTRTCVLVDRSVAMLERAAARVRTEDARRGHLTLLQADLRRPPFATARFDTVLFMGGLHLLEDVATTVGQLARPCAPGGRLFASGLVAETAVGRRYLRLLHRAGEVAVPRREGELRALVEDGLGRPVAHWRRTGSMIYATARIP